MSKNCRHILCEGEYCRREPKVVEPRTPIKRTPIYRAKPNSDLDKWYAYVATIIAAKPICDECGSWISPSDYRNASSHIFPKSIFPSVATHPLNFVIACARNGCHERTHRLDTFSKMRIWPTACNRFELFKDEIKERHKYLDLFLCFANSSKLQKADE